MNEGTSMDERTVLRVEDAVRILGVSRWMVYELIRRGDLPVLRVGRLIRIPRRALEAWIEDNTAPGAAA